MSIPDPTIIKLVLWWNSTRARFRARLTTVTTCNGFLPEFPLELQDALMRWRQAYYSEPDIRLKNKGVTYAPCPDPTAEAKACLKEIKQILETWLDSPDENWRPIRDELIRTSSRVGDQVQVLIEIEDRDENGQLHPLCPLLRRLPWQEWSLLKQDFSQAEVILKVESRNPGTQLLLKFPQPRILVVFGDNTGIDLEPDREVIQTLQKQGADVTLLEQPNLEEFSGALRSEPGYQIFIFSGHSRSNQNGSIGWLELQDNTSLRIDGEAFIRAFRKAVDQGLQLAIFNSCDGIGLANQIAKVGVPRSIVMREVVPNPIAAQFLKYFFKEFAGKPQSLVQAFHAAREQLADCHYDTPYPGATWLPTLCLQDTDNARSLRWQNLIEKPNLPQVPLTWQLVVGLMVLFLAVPAGYRWVRARYSTSGSRSAVNSPVASRISKGEQLLIPRNSNAAKEAGIRAYADYSPDNPDTNLIKEAIQQFRQALNENPNDPESWIYLNNAIADQQSLSTLGRTHQIAVSVPVSSEANAAQEVLRGVAQVQSQFNCGLEMLSRAVRNPESSLNCNGGENNTFLQVVIADDEYDPEIAENLAQAFTEDTEILGIVGHYSSDMSLRAGEIYGKSGLVAISPTATAIKLSGFDPFIFRTAPNDRVAARVLSDYYFDRLNQNNLDKSTKVAVAYVPNNAYSESLIQEFEKLLPEKFVYRCDLKSGDFVAAECIDSSRQQGAEVMLLAPASDETLAEASLLINYNQGDLQLLGGDVVYNSGLIQNLGRVEEVEDLTIAIPWHRSPDSEFANQAEKFWKATINWRTATAYDATQALVFAIEQCDPICDRQQIQATLANPNFSIQGATGTVEFEPSGDRKTTSNELGVLVQVKPNPNGDGYSFKRIDSGD